MSNQKGLAPIFFVFIVALLLGVGLVGHYVSPKDSNLNKVESAEYEKAQIDTKSFSVLIDNAQGIIQDSTNVERYLDDFRLQGRGNITQEANKVLTKDPCDALMIDIEDALKLASAAWHLGDETTGKKLWDWSQEAFRDYAVDAALAVGSTFMEVPNFDLHALSVLERREVYKKSRETFYHRAVLAHQAKLFGFEELHKEIFAGKNLEPVCVQLWEITIETDYDAGDGFSSEEHWTIGATIDDIPIYKNHPELNLPPVARQQNEKGYITVREWWLVNEADEAPYNAEVSGSIWFDVMMSYKENKNDYWEDKIVLETRADLNKEDLVVQWSNGDSEPVWKFYDFAQTNFDVPALYIFRRKPFEIEIIETEPKDPFGVKVTARASFVPTKRVKVEDLNL